MIKIRYVCMKECKRTTFCSILSRANNFLLATAAKKFDVRACVCLCSYLNIQTGDRERARDLALGQVFCLTVYLGWPTILVYGSTSSTIYDTAIVVGIACKSFYLDGPHSSVKNILARSYAERQCVIGYYTKAIYTNLKYTSTSQ